MTCPISETVLYEDKSYKSHRRDTDLYKVTTKRQCVQDKKIAAVKQPTPAKNADLAIDHPEPRPLTDKAIEAIKKLITAVNEDHKKFDGVWDALQTEQMKEYVPKVVQGKVFTLSAKIDTSVGIAQLSIDEKRGDQKALQDDLKSVKASIKELHNRCNALLKSANDDM